MSVMDCNAPEYKPSCIMVNNAFGIDPSRRFLFTSSSPKDTPYLSLKAQTPRQYVRIQHTGQDLRNEVSRATSSES